MKEDTTAVTLSLAEINALRKCAEYPTNVFMASGMTIPVSAMTAKLDRAAKRLTERQR